MVQLEYQAFFDLGWPSEQIGLPWWLSGKESACNAGATGDQGSIPGSGRSSRGRHGNPLQYSCLENPMRRGTWWATVQFSSDQSLSPVQLFVTPWTAACQASLSITNSQSLLKLMSIKSVTPSSHLILCHLLLLPPSIFSSIRKNFFPDESVLCNESVLRIRWPKYWSFSLSISPSKEYSGLIYFRTDWFDLLAVQGTLRSLL